MHFCLLQAAAAADKLIKLISGAKVFQLLIAVAGHWIQYSQVQTIHEILDVSSCGTAFMRSA